MNSNFDSFALPPAIGKALKSMNFIKPTPIQAQCIPVVLEGRDVMGMAQTGTGKTGAFGIPAAARLLQQPEQGLLVLLPTRELAMQVHAFMVKLGGQNLRPALIIGGQSLKQQARELNSRPRVLIATPGRLADHLRSHPKMLVKFSILVLDEADRMMDMGFLPQIRAIVKALPRVRQTLMFSATFPPPIKALANDYLRDPARISVGEVSRPVEKIEQAVVHTTHKEKNDILLDELNARSGSVLIFARTKHRADRLTRYLESYGYKVARIHGNRSQGQRKAAIDGFRSGQFRILVATDIASRGLDIHHIQHVINYDLPQVPEDYIHRIGRTARNGRDGKSLALLVPEDRAMWREITKLNSKTL